MLFLSNSIDDPSNDLIGFDTYAQKLDDAINIGAKMIAVTSPFASGKTSIIELLKKKRKKNKREKFLNIQMWSELNGLSVSNKSCELHRNFLYQLGSSINTKKGTYINRRLSNNYGLLKLHVNRPAYWVAFVVSVISFILGWITKEHSAFVLECVPKLKGFIDYIPSILFGVSILFFIIILTRAEIIFSSQNSEKQREIEADEIIDLYRNEIINKRGKVFSLVCNILRKVWIIKKIPALKGMRYIVVIEDLDRTDNGKAVIHFLKELRKYYLPANEEDSSYQNDVVFIVNIKPESSLLKAEDNVRKNHEEETADISEDNEEETTNIGTENLTKENRFDLLYSKLFDYVLNLQTINVADYDTILSALLEKKKAYLDSYLLQTPTGKLSDIPGMQWIIHGQNINIREIKKRLNLAFVIFETLKERFPDKEAGINFQKCAVAAYVLTEYEEEFSNTNDKTFGRLLGLQLQKKLDEETTLIELSTNNEEYSKTIHDLVSSKLIGEDYRLYFYNYPKNSKMYNNDELNIQNAILYGVMCKQFEAVAKKVVNSESDVVKKSLNKLSQLELPLPQTVIKTESLFLSAIRFEYKSVIAMFGRMNVTDASLDKSISTIIGVLKYDPDRKVYTQDIFKDFCSVWEKIFNETHLLKFREELCAHFSDEILFFSQLFGGEHSVITQKEMELLSLENSLKLLNLTSKNFSISHVKYIIDRFSALPEITDDMYNKVSGVLTFACEQFSKSEVIDSLLQFMIKTNVIVPEFEKSIYDLLTISPEEYDDYDVDAERINNIFAKYRKLIDSVSVNDLTDNILEHINSLDDLKEPYDYSPSIAQILYDKQYYLMSTLIKLEKDIQIDFSDSRIINDIRKNIGWLKSRERLALNIRNKLLLESKNLNDYLCFFSKDFPLITKDEFSQLTNNENVSIEKLLDYIPCELITEEAVEYISRYFNKEHRNNNVAFEIIRSLKKYSDEIVFAFFEKIDFSHAFLFYTFAKDKKNAVKKMLCEQLELDTYEGKLRFMELTRYLDEELERALLDNMDDDMEDRYVKLIGKKLGPTQIKPSTIANLKSFKSIYVFAPWTGVNDKLFEEKEYIYHVVSTTLYAKKFELKEETNELLWPVYIEIFSNPAKYAQTRGYMKENKDFMEKLVETGIYVDFSDTVLEDLSYARQNEKLVDYVFEKGTNFAIKYFSSLKDGFVDYATAKLFIEKVTSSKYRTVLVNNSVRNSVYEKLVDPSLKTKYTKFRKSAGCSY